MNNFCVRYLQNNTAYRTISNIFKTYKQSCENFFKKERIKRNQSEPMVAAQQRPLADDARCKPKSEVDLQSRPDKLSDWSNARFDDNSSQDSLKITWSNSAFDRSPSAIDLSNKNSDLNIQEKFCPGRDDENVSLKRAYPWQNFNIGDDRKPRYDADEAFNFRKSILRRSEAKSLTALKEVKFNKMASMMVYPKDSYGVLKQSRISLTNVGNGGKSTTGRKRKVKETIDQNKLGKIGYAKPPGCSRKGAKGKERARKCTPPVEPSNFWYFNKKQKIC